MTHLLAHIGYIHENLSPVELIEHSLSAGESQLGSDGQLCVLTGVHTGRAANDKYIVNHVDVTDVAWGAAGAPLSVENFEKLNDLVRFHLNGKEVYVIDFQAGPAKCRLITELAWQALFVCNLFQRIPSSNERPDLMIVAVPSCEADPIVNGTRSATFIASDFKQGLTLIGGTQYAGEIKKSVFTYLSWILPTKGILPMHSSVTTNITNGGDAAVFFGLSGTGKTTLSADHNRRLLGDDEHGWTPAGMFNFEGGCYAKAIKLSCAGEPAIWKACHKFATVLENVVLNLDRTPDFNSAKYAENTRAAYPIDYIMDAYPRGSSSGHPKSIIMLTCDAYGVLPSVSRLSHDAAIYHFLSGYTAKVAGTEKGVLAPTAAFSTCFGAPFMPRQPIVYAGLLRKRISEHMPRIYLVNTGWVGGPAGVGTRMKLDYTRGVVSGILNGDFDHTKTKKLMPFNLDVPIGIPDEDPRASWADPAAYDAQAKMLAELFVKNFNKFEGLPESIVNAGPKL